MGIICNLDSNCSGGVMCVKTSIRVDSRENGKKEFEHRKHTLLFQKCPSVTER